MRDSMTEFMQHLQCEYLTDTLYSSNIDIVQDNAKTHDTYGYQKVIINSQNNFELPGRPMDNDDEKDSNMIRYPVRRSNGDEQKLSSPTRFHLQRCAASSCSPVCITGLRWNEGSAPRHTGIGKPKRTNSGDEMMLMLSSLPSLSQSPAPAPAPKCRRPRSPPFHQKQPRKLKNKSSSNEECSNAIVSQSNGQSRTDTSSSLSSPKSLRYQERQPKAQHKKISYAKDGCVEKRMCSMNRRRTIRGLPQQKQPKPYMKQKSASTISTSSMSSFSSEESASKSSISYSVEVGDCRPHMPIRQSSISKDIVKTTIVGFL